MLQEVRSAAFQLENTELLRLRDPREVLRGEAQRLYLLEEFVSENDEHRENYAIPEITEIINRVCRVIEKACEVRGVAQLWGSPPFGPARGSTFCAVLLPPPQHAVDEERLVRLQVGDEAEQEAFTKSGVIIVRGPQVKTQAMSTLRHQKMDLIKKYKQCKEEKELLPNLVKLADCILMEALMASGLQAAEQLRGLFAQFESKQQHKGIFNGVVGFGADNPAATRRLLKESLGGPGATPGPAPGSSGVGDLSLTPSRKDVEDAVLNLISKTAEILISVPRPLQARYLLQYFPPEADGFRHGLDPAAMLRNDEMYNERRSRVFHVIADSYIEADQYAQVFRERRNIYEYVLKFSSEQYMQESRDPAAVIRDLEMLKGWRASVEWLKTNHAVGVVNLDAKHLKSLLQDQTLNIFLAMREQLASLTRATCEEVNKEMQSRAKDMGKRPMQLEDFSLFVRAVQTCRRQKEPLFEQARRVLELYDSLRLYDFRFDVKRDQVPLDDLKEHMSSYDRRLEDAQQHVDQHWPAMIAALEKGLFEKDQELLDVVTELSNPVLFVDPDADPSAVLQRLEGVGARLTRLQGDYTRIVGLQDIFNFPHGQNVNLDQALKDFHMRKVLWESMAHFEEVVHQWVHEMNIPSLNLEEIQSFLNDQLKQSYRLARLYKDDPVAARLGEEVESFKIFEKLLTDVASPALQSQHWEQIFQALNVPVPKDGCASITFKDLLEWGLEDHSEEVDSIVNVAQREYG